VTDPSAAYFAKQLAISSVIRKDPSLRRSWRCHYLLGILVAERFPLQVCPCPKTPFPPGSKSETRIRLKVRITCNQLPNPLKAYRRKKTAGIPIWNVRGIVSRTKT
jgi:hypothetical protein